MTDNAQTVPVYSWLRPLGVKLVPMLMFTVAAFHGSAATTQVRMVNFAYEPRSVTINVGDTIRWTNTTVTAHNVVSDNSSWTASSLFTSPGTFSVTFNNPGVFGYFCSPHRSFGMTGVITVQGAANQAPSVALTSPPSGSTLAAPATITLVASAADSDGTVANVQFFSGTTLLGNDASSPYSQVVNNLSAGTYQFSARAVDNLGLSRTSAEVTVSVVNPAPLLFEGNVTLSQGNLRFNVATTPGLSYTLEQTTNLTDWQLWTNFLATGTVTTFSTPATGEPRRYFRARLLPNP